MITYQNCGFLDNFFSPTSHQHLTFNSCVNVHSRNNSSFNRFESFKNFTFYPVLLSGIRLTNFLKKS